MPKGRRSLPPEEGRLLKIEDLVASPTYFEQTMTEFFTRGGMSSLQRWFIAAQDRDKAEQIANIMMDRFADKLLEVMPK